MHEHWLEDAGGRVGVVVVIALLPGDNGCRGVVCCCVATDIETIGLGSCGCLVSVSTDFGLADFNSSRFVCDLCVTV